MNNDNKDAIVLGTLKKEKSSKPIFVVFVFVFLIGACFAFPYIKSYFGDDFTLNDLLNRNTDSNTNPTTTIPTTIPITTSATTTTSSSTTTSTTTQNNNDIKKLTCIYRNYEYIYTFNEENNLIKIENNYSYTSSDSSILSDTLFNYQTKSNNINSLGGKCTITTSENSFKFTAIIDTNIDLKSIDTNYYQLNTKYDIISSELIKKGFDCK